MTFAVPHQNYSITTGSSFDDVSIPVYSTRAPTSSDIRYPIGKRWINTSANSEYTYTSNTAGNPPSANWIATGGGSVVLSSLTGDSGTATPSSGNIKIAGTASQITTTASGFTVTLSLPNPFVTPGELDVTAGNLILLAGTLSIQGDGNKLLINASGGSASVGVSSAMSGTPGSVTINTANVNNSASLIYYSRRTAGGTLGHVSVSAVSNGVSFTLLSTDNETSTFDWWIIN